MERELPAGLSDQQRSVLLEFFKGHISAGQLTQRLGIEVPEAASCLACEPSPRKQRVVPEMHRERPVRFLNPLGWAGQ
jgi:hypothetical protein